MDEKERTRTLGLTLGQIEKQFGKGSIVRLGSKEAIVQVAARCSPSPSSARSSHPSAVRSMRRRMLGCGSEKSQVPPASHALSLDQTGNSARVRGSSTLSTVCRSISRSR